MRLSHKPFRKHRCALPEVHARATVRDDPATDGPPATDEVAIFETHLRNDPAGSPGVYATASATTRSDHFHANGALIPGGGRCRECLEAQARPEYAAAVRW
jgi:hypothetical protein